MSGRHGRKEVGKRGRGSGKRGVNDGGNVEEEGVRGRMVAVKERVMKAVEGFKNKEGMRGSRSWSDIRGRRKNAD